MGATKCRAWKESGRRLLLALLLWGGGLPAAPTARAQDGYAQKTVRGIRYHVYTSVPADIGIYWADSNGVPFRTFAAVESNLTARGYAPQFLMNGGIFEPGGVPAGLLVQDGRTERELNRRDGAGNFYLKPNGVFHLDAAGAHITETGRYAALSGAPAYAVQSGPLLLEDGQIHPAFSPASSNRLHRNGVGVLPDGKVLLAVTEISQERLPSLYDFARFFRDAGCRNALFLDGDLSQFVVYPRTNAPCGNHFGSVIAVRKESNP